jgi:hypothetical protein
VRTAFESTRGFAGSGFGIVAAGLLALFLHGNAAVITFAVVAALLAIWWLLSTLYLARRRLLKRDLRDVSQRLFVLHGRYQAGQDAAIGAAFQVGAPAVGGSADLLAAYDQDYSARALALFDKAAERGLVPTRERLTVENPTNPIGVRQVAQLLGVASEKL